MKCTPTKKDQDYQQSRVFLELLWKRFFVLIIRNFDSIFTGVLLKMIKKNMTLTYLCSSTSKRYKDNPFHGIVGEYSCFELILNTLNVKMKALLNKSNSEPSQNLKT